MKRAEFASLAEAQLCGKKCERGIFMKLYLKQEVFTLLDSYNIYDESQLPVYKVKTRIYKFPPGFDIVSYSGDIIFTVSRHFQFFGRKYDILHNDVTVATIERRFALFERALDITTVTGDVFSVDGDYFGWNFTITKNGMPYATIKKVLLSWGDSYEIDVYDDRECAFATALVIAIDDTFHDGRRR